MLPKHKYLLTYRYSELIHDGTVQFCSLFLNDWKYKRTVEQMTQAARSGKQNIVEGVGQSATSKGGEIKLLGVAKASIEELICDFEDFLRQRNLIIWSKTDPRILNFRQLGFNLSNLSNLSHLGDLKKKLSLPNESEEAANLLLTFCHLATYLLDRQIKVAEDKFIKTGGYSENLLKKRLSYKLHK
ncbi:four helix bundle protein [Candidatus Gottesmanbacteria bacterium]|nr:four helix bundle protein [Candidatus Gottesmanbacteria bacterium]